MAFNFFQNDSGSFLRQIQVSILPLRQSSINKMNLNAIVLSSEGRQNDLRIVFNIQKNIMAMGMPNIIQLMFYNLSPGTKQFLSNNAISLVVQAGYKEGVTKLQRIGSASIASSNPTKSNTETITSIVGYDGQDGLAQAVSSYAFTGETTIKRIVKLLASDIPGVEVSDANILIDGSLSTGSKGRILTGRTSNMLTKLAREFGFSWSIQDGVFAAIADDSNTGNLFIISSKNKNLIRADMRTDNITGKILEVDIESVLDPRINPGDLVKIESDVNPLVNNTYQVTGLTHIGDSHSDTWTTRIQCKLNDFQIQASSASALGATVGF